MDQGSYPKDIIDCENLILSKIRQINELKDDIFKLKQTLLFKKQTFIKKQISEHNYPNRELSNDEIQLYSRQMIIPEIGILGQLSIKKSSILVVGAGGLGCPSLNYLCRGGVETFGIVDYDTVDMNNIHRQTLYEPNDIGISKVEISKRKILEINPLCKVVTYHCQLHSNNAVNIIEKYDIVLDCTDNVATRYLLNDACVLLKKPLVSASALKLEGQLTVYNYKEGPCYRCLFPKPPPPETVTNCSDGGILGCVTGIMGSLQALEAFKIILNFSDILSGRLLLFDASTSTSRNVKLRGKNPKCSVCSKCPEIIDLIDYEQFCGMKASDKDYALNVLDHQERMTVEQYKSDFVDTKKDHLLIDVRSPIEYEFCKIPNSMNIPLKYILEDKFLELIKTYANAGSDVIIVCRRGNDSQLAVRHLSEKLRTLAFPKDIIGGLYAWQHKVDKTFPIY
ncbi:adenylyltransferase and sulfurtransferase MOCS3 [Condylostylus longicornis]|uniref:adenylyltransferase and sulfurtransferase MOCS3 n=1 Tax=Condylostylus longicornis TaxID=2530218 RepID=UPI00244E0205|nr:adenylyltransferase and sulfurtransferase MOCS3 [Condylostylus longicornis]